MTKSSTRINKGQSLLEFPSDFVAVDIETTGFDPIYDDIIEISGVKFSDGKEVDKFQSLISPKSGRPVGAFITELTGITDEMLADAPGIDEALPDFLSFLGNALIVGHNVNFDINFLYDAAESLSLPPLSNDFVDTMRISRRLYKDFPNHQLATLIKELGVGEKVEHRALSDCVQAAQCLAKMKEYAEQIGGIPMPLKRSGGNSKRSGGNSKLRAKDIKAEVTDFDVDSPIWGMTFVFTGTLEKMARKEAMQAVVNAGGFCGDSVTTKTNYLVLGNNIYCSTIKDGKSSKQKKAEKMQLAGANIATISENVFYDMLEA